ncbi:UNVERIFIED_CONTAM: hypothetical protein Slati_1664900 [Sesamum latifolium]|uniref:Uncharacterized protein n=1 Tax=Sesamum latifolium TaxID=2727402 RepID=A0AAW2XBZ4_9LAMI
MLAIARWKNVMNLSSLKKRKHVTQESQTAESSTIGRQQEHFQQADPKLCLLVPKHFSKKSCSESPQFTESRTSLDGQLAEVAGNRLSDLYFLLKLYSGDYLLIFHTLVPALCHVECAMELHNSVTSQAVDTDTCPSACSSVNQLKESSAVPQLSSTYTSVKSGPVRPEVSSGMDNSEREKASASNRGRSSPLRRLLEPLLKNKGAQSSENVGLPNGGLRSMTVRTTATKGPYQNRKPEASNFQALLQLTLKNGLPFFKLVVDNSNDMLAATVKKLPTSEKSDPCMIFSFYSVHEIRKKSMNWISQGSKGKSCSLGYNFVGQMNISNSYHLEANAANKEIAAIIVKNSTRKPNDAELSDDNRRNKNSNGIVAILPGGVHGWDVGCKLRILADHKNCSNILQASMSSATVDHVNLYIQGGKQKSNKPVFTLEPFSNGFYSVELDASVSLLEAFAICVAYVTCWKFPEIIDSNGQSDAEHLPEVNIGADKRKIASTFQEQFPAKYVTCPPLSPVGRI